MQILTNAPLWVFYGVLILFFVVMYFWTKFCTNTANGQVVLFFGSLIIGVAVGFRHAWWMGIIGWLVSFSVMAKALPDRAPDYWPGLPESPHTKHARKIMRDVKKK